MNFKISISEPTWIVGLGFRRIAHWCLARLRKEKTPAEAKR